MAGAMRGFNKHTFNTLTKLNIRFVGEGGLDAGGPSREFMRLVLKEIRDSQIFHGDEHKFLTANVSALQDRLYFVYAKMLAYFLLHNGPAPCFFSENMYQLIVEGLEGYTPPMDDVNPHLSAIINRIREATTPEEFYSAAEEVEAITSCIGGMHLLSVNRKDELVTAITNHAINQCLKPAYEQFIDGLSTLGVLNAIRASPSVMKCLFTYTSNLPTAEKVISLTSVQFGVVGSNKRGAEEEGYAIWLDYLEYLEGKGEIGSMLAFITGLTDLPPLGFDPPLNITFIHPEEVTNEFDRGVPYADTCANTLRLPVGLQYSEFRSVMDTILFKIGNVFANE